MHLHLWRPLRLVTPGPSIIQLKVFRVELASKDMGGTVTELGANPLFEQPGGLQVSQLLRIGWEPALESFPSLSKSFAKLAYLKEQDVGG